MNPFEKAQEAAASGVTQAYWLGAEVGVAAEKERCAKLAEGFGGNIGAAIAAAIRGDKPKGEAK